MLNSLFVFGILYIYQAAVVGTPTSERCLRTEQNTHGCCDGYRWDSAVDNCVECTPGYSGPGCVISCPFPLYGENCQNICKCSATKYCNFIYGCLEKQETTATEQIIVVSNSDNIFNSKHHFEGRSTLTISKFTKPNIDGNLENRIQTIWQFVLIMLAVFSGLAFIYLGKCVHRQWTSRSLQVGNTNTSAPESALNVSNQIECLYEQIQNIEYEDPERYLPALHDDSGGDGMNISQEKMISVSISSLKPPNVEALCEEHKSEYVMYENQPNSGIREIDDPYLTPTT